MNQAVPQEDLDHIHRYTSDIWETFRGSRLFITGGTGFVGKWLLESFLHANRVNSLKAEVVVLSRNPTAFAQAMPHIAAQSTISLHSGDIRTFKMPAGDFSHIIHGATDAVVSSAALDTFDVTVQGTRHLLDFCHEKGVSDLLLISSGAVYGRQPTNLERVAEDYPGAPSTTDVRSAYGEGKRASEWLATAYAAAGGTACKIARCFAFVGPHLPLDRHFAVGNFIRDAMQGSPIQIGGDGTPLRSYLYAADLAAWLWTIFVKGASGEAYNVGSDASLSISDLAQLVANVADREVPIDFAKKPQPGMTPERYVPSIDKARAGLGLDVWISLEQAIMRTIAWHRRDSSTIRQNKLG